MTWRLQIRHTTRFSYGSKANASYNEARLTPLTLPSQTTLESRIEVEPAATIYRYHDYWGTHVSAFDLQEAHAQLVVTATSTVETEDPTPRLLPAVDWSVLYDPATLDRFSELLAPTQRTALDDEIVNEVTEHVAGLTPSEAAASVGSWVHDQVSYVPGSTGVQTSAREAWVRREGVCQDMAHLTAGLLRRLGIPARYVSGYVHPKPESAIGMTVKGQSHAWVEWWDGEWVAHDPTNDKVVGVEHVVVARGRDYSDVAPLKGVYQGRPATELAVSVDVTRLG
jgi:transglutaminase-like putative cysteine protease